MKSYIRIAEFKNSDLVVETLVETKGSANAQMTMFDSIRRAFSENAYYRSSHCGYMSGTNNFQIRVLEKAEKRDVYSVVIVTYNKYGESTFSNKLHGIQEGFIKDYCVKIDKNLTVEEAPKISTRTPSMEVNMADVWSNSVPCTMSSSPVAYNDYPRWLAEPVEAIDASMSLAFREWLNHMPIARNEAYGNSDGRG